MIVLVKETDFPSHVTKVYLVDTKKCPSKIKKLIEKTKNGKNYILANESITFSEPSNSEWLVAPPCMVDQTLAWYIDSSGF